MEVGRKIILLLPHRWLYYFIFMSLVIYYFALKFKKKRKYIHRESVHNMVQILKSPMPHLNKYRERLLDLITLLGLTPENLHLCG